MLVIKYNRKRKKKEEEEEKEEEEDVHSGSCVTWTEAWVGDLQFSFDFTDKPLHNISF